MYVLRRARVFVVSTLEFNGGKKNKPKSKKKVHAVGVEPTNPKDRNLNPTHLTTLQHVSNLVRVVLDFVYIIDQKKNSSCASGDRVM